MEIKIIEEKLKRQWEEYVEKKPTIAWQSYEWSTVVKKHYKVGFFPIAAFNRSEICGILPLYLIKNILGKSQLISVPYAVAGGIVADDPETESLLLQKAKELYERYHCSNITFKQYKTKINSDLRIDDNFYNRELDLSKSLDEMWKNLGEKNKKQIDATKRYDLKLIHPCNEIDRFYDLLLMHNKHSGIPCVSKKWIKDLIAFDMYSIAFLKMKNTTVAATMVKEHKKTVSFPFTSLPDMKAESMSFAYTLNWKLIERFKEQGKEIFHSGRIPKTDQTYEYRLGWGGKKYGYYYQYYPNTLSFAEYSRKRGRKREILTFLWKKFPVWVTRLIGPYVVKHYP